MVEKHLLFPRPAQSTPHTVSHGCFHIWFYERERRKG